MSKTSKRRIVYIERPQDAVYYSSSKTNVHHKFYKFHDSLTDEKVYISFGVNTHLYNSKYAGRPVFLRLEKYYHPIDDIYSIPNVFDTSWPLTVNAYFNAKPLSQKQIEKVKAEYAELFI